MKAFISSSVNDNNLYLVSLLSFKLQENNFRTSTSNDFFKNELSFTTKNSIQNSHLFLGIVTDDGVEKDRVLNEWRFANSNGVPNILLIEDTVPVKKGFKGNIVRFNREDPQPAIDIIQKRMNSKPVKSNDTSEALSWILGGAAVVAFLSWVTSDD
jgi:hypothetical protein